MPHITTPEGICWHYQEEGRGEPIVFLHGWGGNLRLWSLQAEYFSRKYRVIRIDLPGHGQSGWVKVSFREMAVALEHLAQQLNIKKINCVGSSLGGLMILKWFDLFPQRFRRMILVGVLPKFLKAEGYPYGLELQQLRKLSAQLQTDYPVIVNIFFRSLFTRWERQSDRFQYLTQFKETDSFPIREALEEFLRFLEEEDARGVLKKIGRSLIPVQIFNGTEDYICPQEAVNCFKERILCARVELFKDCGHFPFLTKPVEFNERLEHFLLAYA